MSSQATMDGSLALTVTFRIGTDIDRAQVQVQNRVAQALPRLPEEVRAIGVSTLKSSPAFLMVVHLTSPDGRYDSLYLRNYATLNIRDTLARLPGMGDVRVFGAGDYAMRVWLDPQKMSARDLTTGDVVGAIREQNLQVAAGQIGAPPAEGAEFQLALNTQGPPRERGGIRRRRRQDRPGRRSRAAARHRAPRARRGHLRHAVAARQRKCRRHSRLPGAGLERARALQQGARRHGDAEEEFPAGHGLQDHLRPDAVRAPVHRCRRRDPARGRAAGRARGHPVPADLARVDHSAGRGARVGHRHVRGAATRSASRSTRCRCSAWCWPSASWSTTPSSSSKTSSGTSPTGSSRSRPPRRP